MRKNINYRMIAIALVAILATMAFCIGIFNKLFQKQVMDDLRTTANILTSRETIVHFVEKDYDPKINNLRITVIDADGSVEYDSNADIGNMSNHSDRPEVQEAFEKGRGQAIRKSDTRDMNTFYYAERLESGKVLRVAREAISLYSLLMLILPSLVGVFFCLALISILIARYTTKHLMAPIEEMARDLDHIDTIEPYEELKPLLDKIHSQHQDIIKSAEIRQQFTANVSHELKTPLTAISGYSELIATGIVGKSDTRRFAGEIHKNANRLLTLINDSIRLSEMDVASDAPQMEEVDLAEIIRNCVAMLQIQAEKYEVVLIAADMPGPVIVRANANMMEELIYNLCDNAIRYNHANGYVQAGVTEEKKKIVLTVEDNGIGISREHQERIFERFYRVDKSHSKSTGGTGLGLAIVKHIVEQHGAKIEVESEQGKGTKISVIFPKEKENR